MARKTRAAEGVPVLAPVPAQDESAADVGALAWARGEDASTGDVEAAAGVPVMETPASMLEGAQRGHDPEAGPPPLVRRYRVERDGRASFGGNLVLLKAGKVIEEQAYDVAVLRAAGIQLAEI